MLSCPEQPHSRRGWLLCSLGRSQPPSDEGVESQRRSRSARAISDVALLGKHKPLTPPRLRVWALLVCGAGVQDVLVRHKL